MNRRIASPFASKTLVVLVLLLMLGFELRLYHLGEKAVWWDEAWSVWTAQQNIVQTTEITARDVHPPLYEWVLSGWVRVTGISEFSVRYLSLLWGILAVAVVYPLTRRLNGKGSSQMAGLTAMFFIALSALHIRWSQETRMYAQASLLTALACYAYLRIKDRWSIWWLVLIASCATVPLTHYLGAFVVVILNIHWLLTIRTRKASFHKRWIASMLCVGAVLVAWIVYALPRIRSGGAESNTPPAFIFQLAATLISVGASINVEQYTIIALLAVSFLFVGLALYIRRNRFGGLLVWLFVLFPPLAIFLLNMPNRFYHPKPEERYLIIFIPVVYAGVGIAIVRLRKLNRAIGIGFALLLCGLYGYAFLRDADNRYYRDDYAMMLRTVNLLAQPDEPVFFVSGDRYPLVYYHLNRAVNGMSPLTIQEITRVDENTDVESLIRVIIGNNDKFWLVEIERGLGDSQNKVIPYLDAHYKRILSYPVSYNALTYYSRDNAPIPTSSATLAPIVKEVRPGDTIRVGVLANESVCLVKGQSLTDSTSSSIEKACIPTQRTWNLAQIPIYAAYPSGLYTVATTQTNYPIELTHGNELTGYAENLKVAYEPMLLLGYSTPTQQLRAGDTLDITFYWKANRVDEGVNYTVFAHLLGDTFNPATNGPLWAGKDSYPADTPTSAMWPGLVFSDRRQMVIPIDAPAGNYKFEVGLYRLDTGERLKSTDTGSDSVIIQGFTVTN